jgi:DNA polymerase V
MPFTPCKGFALIDCNNFFVSCERVFKPHLNRRPVAVLSSNDGCIIARSKEVKALGIPMGAPLFKYKDLIERHKVITFSSNFKLYGDLSDRVMSVITSFCPELEIYSIDEAFIPLTFQTPEDFLELRARILKWTGIPVSIGLGPTKTLAKAANHLAKKKEEVLFSLLDAEKRETYLKEISITDIWGIGRAHAKTLTYAGIHTAYDLKESSEHWVKKHLQLTGLRTVLELRGIPCHTNEIEDPKRKSLIYSKSFGRPIESKAELLETTTHYASRAAEKIRKKGYLAKNISLYLKTKESSFIQTYTLSFPSNSSIIFIEVAHSLLNKLFKPGEYLKAGIFLNDLSSKQNTQFDLIESYDLKQDLLMSTLDEVNKKYGVNTLFFLGEGLKRPWRSKSRQITANYTSKWCELLTINIDA